MPTTPLKTVVKTTGICAMDWYYAEGIPAGVQDKRGWDSLTEAFRRGGSRSQYWGKGIAGEDDMGGEEIAGEVMESRFPLDEDIGDDEEPYEELSIQG